MADLDPITRKEMFYDAILGNTATSALPEPVTREEVYLKDIAENGGGGGEGTRNYNQLINRPKVNNVVLEGDKTTEDLIPIGDGLQFNENGELEAVGGGGGSAELESAVTANTTVGAIASGTTLPQGTTFTEFAQKLLISEIAPTMSMTMTKTGNVAKGDSYNETLSLTVSSIGTAKTIDKIAWYKGSTLLQEDTIGSSTAGTWTYTVADAVTDSATFKAVVTYTKSNDTSATMEKTTSISFYYNKFRGVVDTLTPSEATVEALTSALATGKGGTYSFTVSAGRICYAYPKSLGALTSIKDGNGFSLFDSFTRTEQTYMQAGDSVVYYRYVLTDATTVSGYSVTFA